MDAAYLQQTVGPVLAQALAVIVQTNPRDPIEFLGEYLIKTGGGASSSSSSPAPSANTGAAQQQTVSS